MPFKSPYSLPAAKYSLLYQNMQSFGYCVLLQEVTYSLTFIGGEAVVLVAWGCRHHLYTCIHVYDYTATDLLACLTAKSRFTQGECMYVPIRVYLNQIHTY